ncbi:MAG: hypothetical protein IJ802_05410 [Kiritimatiellae bacterium]|nr:hypothetical protein [Kiritimatiellia bacterium]
MKRFAALAAFAIFGAGVFALNHIYQYCWDDFIYALDASGHYYSSIGDVWIENLRNNYRPVVHFFVRLFCGLLADRKILFDIANTAAALLSAALLCRVALRKWRFPAAKAALALAL